MGRLLRNYAIILTSLSLVDAFIIPQQHQSPLTSSSQQQHSTTILFVKQSRSTLTRPPTSTPPPPSDPSDPSNDDENEEVFGTKFFGGSAVKEELFDAELEENADRMQRLYPRQKKKVIRRKPGEVEEKDEDLSYERFEDRETFPDRKGKEIGVRLQSAINRALYEVGEDEEDEADEKLEVGLLYDAKMTLDDWVTPFRNGGKGSGEKVITSSSCTNPMEGLSAAIEYYKRVDVAIVAARTVEEDDATGRTTLEVRWEISVQWPNAFESRVLVSGTSTVVTTPDLNPKPTIISQIDTLDTAAPNDSTNPRIQNIVTSVANQLTPRFWDLYHVSMTPSAELMPRLHPKTGGDLLSGLGLGIQYKEFTIPPRLVLRPTLVDVEGREAREAEAAPNHAFTSIIRTTGRTGQRFITASPLEVSIRRRPRSEVYTNEDPNDADHTSEGKKKKLVPVIEWSIPLPPEFLSYDRSLPLPSLDPLELAEEFESDSSFRAYAPSCSYVYRPRRRVATVSYGGSPQDADVAELRKRLYERVVVKDKKRPKLDEEGRPMFFFLQNDAKCCFTADGGFGMAVYDWRPEGVKTNEVGIELEDGDD